MDLAGGSLIETGVAGGVDGTPSFSVDDVRYDGDVEAGELGPAVEPARDVARSSTAAIRSA